MTHTHTQPLADVIPDGRYRAEVVRASFVPAGPYLAAIVGADFVPTGPNDEQYVELTFRIIEGLYAGRELTGLFDPNSSNKLTRTVYRGEIAKICRAIGVPTLKNWGSPEYYAALFGTPLIIVVRCVTYTDITEEPIIVNQIIDYKKA